MKVNICSAHKMSSTQEYGFSKYTGELLKE